MARQKIYIESYLKVTICLPWDIDLNMQTNLSHLEIPQASKQQVHSMDPRTLLLVHQACLASSKLVAKWDELLQAVDDM